MKYFIVLAGCVFLARSAASLTPVNACEQGVLPPEVNVNNCDSLPCNFEVLKEAAISFNFTSPRYLENISPIVYAHVLGLQVSYPLGQKDACDGVTNTPCPLAENEKISYSIGMLLADFPQIALTLEFSIVDKDRNENVVCFMVDIQVVKNSS